MAETEIWKEIKGFGGIMQIKDLKQDKRNYRKHNQKNLDLIKKSVSEVGLGRSVVIDNENEIICGNGLVRTLNKDTKIKVVETDGSELVVVKRTDLATDSDKRKQLAVMDNSTSDSSDFDLELLSEDFEIDTLKDWGVDLVDLELELENLEPDEVIEDEVPEQVETRAKLGDIWQLGKHRLMCGDSTSITDVEKLLNGVKVDMIFTDTPYGMGLNTDWSGAKSKEKFYQEKSCKGTGNKYAQGFVDDFNPKMIDLILSLNVKETFLWGADYFAELLPNKNDGSWIVWDKRSNDDTNELYISQSDKMFGSTFELCWSKNKHKREIARVKWCGIFGTEKEFDRKRHHPTQKPTALVQWFLDRYSKENQVILDLYGGSGSTLLTCEQLNRICYCNELDPHYVDVIIQRWENLTKEKAVLL